MIFLFERKIFAYFENKKKNKSIFIESYRHEPDFQSSNFYFYEKSMKHRSQILNASEDGLKPCLTHASMRYYAVICSSVQVE